MVKLEKKNTIKVDCISGSFVVTQIGEEAMIKNFYCIDL